MSSTERNPELRQDLSEDRIYRLTEAGQTAKANPEGRISRGFLRLISLLDGRASLKDVQGQLTFLTLDDLQLWCDELTRMRLIEQVDARDLADSFVYSGAVDFERSPEFSSAVDQICSALERTPMMPEVLPDFKVPFENAQTARLIAIEAINTTRNITLNGFFAYPSRRATTKSKPSEFRILIVEDDQLQAHMANLIVSREGYVTAQARSIAGFRAALRAQLKPDLVLLDVELPDGDGFEELEVLRAHPDYARMNVVMLTSRSSPSDIAHGVMLGANGYVTKPYTPQTLQSAIRKALNL